MAVAVKVLWTPALCFLLQHWPELKKCNKSGQVGGKQLLAQKFSLWLPFKLTQTDQKEKKSLIYMWFQVTWSCTRWHCKKSILVLHCPGGCISPPKPLWALQSHQGHAHMDNLAAGLWGTSSSVTATLLQPCTEAAASDFHLPGGGEAKQDV